MGDRPPAVGGTPAVRRLSVGFLGTGIMSGHMARRIAQAGHDVAAWNRTAAKVEALSACGVAQASDAAAAAHRADSVVCMLSSGPVCDETLIGGGVLGAMRPGSLLIVMSSIPVATAQRHAKAAAERGVDYLDAPVSGGETGARDDTLAIMAGGTQDAFERACPLLEVMGGLPHVWGWDR
jgi:3-hydroxyisobutyrate dehydrogenase-like beta-hydroxyacid dehydrogenase